MRASFDSDGLQFAWDATSIELASTCLRKYYYSIIASVEPKRKSVHLIFGGIYAAALEHFYRYRAEGDSIDTALRRVVHEALIASWDSATGAPLEFNDAKKTRANLIRSIIWYVDEFGDEAESGIQTYHLSDGAPAVELSFALELSNTIVLCGHLDRVVSYGGHLYWMDQKTTGGTVGPYYFEQFKPHNQFMLYTWAGQTILHSPVKGGIIDAAQVAVGFTRFERHPITFTAGQIEEWLDSAQYHIAAARSAAALRRFPMNLASCGNYGGCPFRSLCARDPAVRENFLQGDYVHRETPWDPITPR